MNIQPFCNCCHQSFPKGYFEKAENRAVHEYQTGMTFCSETCRMDYHRGKEKLKVPAVPSRSIRQLILAQFFGGS